MKDIGRNDPCFCGSGKKYKKCHLLEENISDGLENTEDTFALHPPEAYEGYNPTWVDLGLEQEDKWADIQRKYRVLAKKYHPDVSKGKEKHFARIKYCYESIKTVREVYKKKYGEEYP